MKVMMVLSDPLGLGEGTEARVKGLIEGLKKLGVQVQVVAPSREYSANRVRPLFGGKMPLARLWNPLLVSWRAFARSGAVSRAVKAMDPDVIQLEQDLAGLLAPELRKQSDIPIVMDFHGIWREEMVADGRLSPNSFFYDWISRLDRRIVNSVDYVVVVSNEMKEYVIDYYGGDPSSVYVVPNAAIPKLESRSFKETTNRIVYAGVVTSRENIPLLAKALIYAKGHDTNLDLRISDRGESFRYLDSELSNAGIHANYGWVSEDRFLSYLSACDVGLIPASSHRWRQMATPAKLFDYLSAGVPVVATDIGASWNKIISDNRVGFITENDPEVFAKAILELSRSPDLVHEYGNRAISLVRRELNYDASAAKLLSIYRQAVRG